MNRYFFNWTEEFQFNIDKIGIPFWKQWAFKWSTPGTIDIMIPGIRFYIKGPKLPKGSMIHITAGRWKKKRFFYEGKIHSWFIFLSDRIDG